MSTTQQTEQRYRVEETTPVEALGQVLTQLFADNPPVYDVVDPDALNNLFAPRTDGTPRVDGTVSFSYRGYEFAVNADGDVRIEDA